MKATLPLMNLLLMALCGLLPGIVAGAADVSGQWRAEFDTQIGVQKYLFTFQADGDKLTGKAASEVDGRKREVELKEGRITGNQLSFIEMFQFQDNEIRIRYTGKAGTNEIAFAREVGDFATEEFKATRVVPTPTNAPAPMVANTAAKAPQESRIPRGRDIVLGQDDKPAFIASNFTPERGPVLLSRS